MQLIIAEKPDLGKAIAEAIRAPKDFNREEQVIHTTLHGQPTTIAWCFGHLLELCDPEDYDESYKKWTMEALPFYFQNWKHKVKKDTKGGGGVEKRVKQIGALLQEADTVIHAGDIDDEGQLLIDELLEFHNYYGKVLRLNTNDVSPAALAKALNSMTPNSSHVADGVSAFGRQLSDKVFGYNLTRYFTLINGNGTTLPVGRVKMPTLGLVVRRDRLIEGHSKTVYYTLGVKLDIDDKQVPAKYVPAADNPRLQDGKILKKAYIDVIAAKIKGRTFSNINVSKQEKEQSPPLPFNQTALYTYCANKWNLQPGKVRVITQNLREKHHAITYNRSDCQYLGEETFAEAPKTLPLVCANIGMDTCSFDTTIHSRCFNNANLTAHTAIIPTMTKQDLSSFTPDERRVYDSIARYYLIQFMPPATKEVTKLLIPSEDGGSIVATSTEILNPGYLTLLNDFGEDEDDDGAESFDEEKSSVLSSFSSGRYAGKVVDTSTQEQETKPPARYTQATLVKDMVCIAKYVENERVRKLLLGKDKDKKGENGSIGTPATRDVIITELIKAGYLREDTKGKKSYLISTDLGREFYDILPDSVRKVDVSAKWWYEQEKIKAGEMTPDAMARDVLRTVDSIIKSGVGKMTNSEKYSKGMVGGDSLGQCPKCGGDVFETAKGYRCISEGCKFSMFKDDKFFVSLGKRLPPKAVSIILRTGRIAVKNCKSKKSGKSYDAVVLVDFSEDRPKYSFAGVEDLEEIGKCPKCGSRVVEQGNSFSCSSPDCKFILWKSSKFLDSMGKKLSASAAKELLAKGRIGLKGCKSSKGTKYDCILVADFSGEYMKYTREFKNDRSGCSKGKAAKPVSPGGLNGRTDRQDFNFF